MNSFIKQLNNLPQVIQREQQNYLNQESHQLTEQFPNIQKYQQASQFEYQAAYEQLIPPVSLNQFVQPSQHTVVI